MSVLVADPMSILQWGVVVGFATYAIAQTIAWREGPFAIFEKWRNYLEDHSGTETTLDGEVRSSSSLTRLFQCPYCLGVWVAFFLTFLTPFSGFGIFLFCWWVAVGVQAFMQNVTDYFEKQKDR